MPSRRLVLLAAALLAACSALPAPVSLARSGPESFAPLVKRVMPSVVSILVTDSGAAPDNFAGLPPELQRQLRERFRVQRKPMSGAGAGFIIDPTGYIVTNRHVVGAADRIMVGLNDGTQVQARVVGADELTDIALIKIDPIGPLQAATWGDSRAEEVGDWVIAAGNPYGLGGSVSAGIVSARGRDLGAGPFDDYIQIDAPINPGNSGGPLFNTEGQVIGVNTAIYTPNGGSVGIGFAVPSELASRIVAELRERGRIDRGWLGVTLQDVPPNRGAGVGIADVARNGPGARGGLRIGDIVTAVNGTPVESVRGVVRAVASVPPGSAVQLTLRRAGQSLSMAVTVGRRPRIEEE